MITVHKIRLSPNNKQRTYFAKSCGIARFAYNWALAKWREDYEAGKKVSEVSLRKDLNAIKKEEFSWMQEVTKVAPQQAIKNLGTAFGRFFKKQAKYPRFKKKGIHDSFRADNGPSSKGADAVTIKGRMMKLPRVGWVKMTEHLRFDGQVKSVTISRRANNWYASVSVDTESVSFERKNNGSVGIDVGVTTLATLSNGKKEEGPKAHKALLKRLKRKSRTLSKKKRGSSNYAKAKMKLSRLHARIANIRQDALHKLTTKLVENYDIIGIETLNVKGMVRNRRLSRSIMDQSFYEFRRQLAYKCERYGTQLVEASMFFPSSKTCSVCGSKNEQLALSEREWQCSSCSTIHDRDINAAKNLEVLAVSSTVSACGAGGSGLSA